MYAVIEFQWHQYIVSQWSTIIVDRFDSQESESVSIDSVLCVFDSDHGSVSVWAPYVSGACVNAKIVSHQKWDKINVVKFHRKNRYERNIWFRPHQTTLFIESIVS